MNTPVDRNPSPRRSGAPARPASDAERAMSANARSRDQQGKAQDHATRTLQRRRIKDASGEERPTLPRDPAAGE